MTGKHMNLNMLKDKQPTVSGHVEPVVSGNSGLCSSCGKRMWFWQELCKLNHTGKEPVPVIHKKCILRLGV